MIIGLIIFARKSVYYVWLTECNIRKKTFSFCILKEKIKSCLSRMKAQRSKSHLVKSIKTRCYNDLLWSKKTSVLKQTNIYII